MLPFFSRNSGPISIMSWSHDKRYHALPTYTYSCSRAGKPRNEARVKADKESRGIHSIRRRRVGYMHMFMCTHVFFLPVDS